MNSLQKYDCLKSLTGSRIAIIPARKGSTRIRQKNLQKINDISLVERAIITSKESGVFDEIILSTNCNEISAEGSSHDILIQQRSENNSNSMASTEDVVEEVFSSFPNIISDQSVVYLIQCTSPFLESSDLKGCENLLIKKDDSINSILSGYLAKDFIWTQELNKNDWLPLNYKLDHRPRSQEIQPYFVENGAFYVFGKRNFVTDKLRLHGKIAIYPMQKLKSIDIDDPIDLEIAQYLHTFIN